VGGALELRRDHRDKPCGEDARETEADLSQAMVYGAYFRRELAAHGTYLILEPLQRKVDSLKGVVYRRHSLVKPYVGPLSSFHDTAQSPRARRLAPTT
jgi:hypothetical protein